MATKTFWQKQKQKIINDLTIIAEGVDLSAQNEAIDKYFIRQIKPRDFMSNYSDEIKHEKAYEENCIILSQYTNKIIKVMTVKEYFSLLSYHNERIRKGHGRKPD